MKRRSFFLLIAAGLASVSLLAAPASVHANLVFHDSGGGTVDVLGTAAGANITDFNATLTEINHSSVNLPLSLTTLQLAYSGGTSFSGSGSKTIGTSGNEATLDFSITSGNVGTSFLVVKGTITSVPSPGPVNGYDFSTMLGGNIALTVISSDPTIDFTKILNNAGSSAINVGFGLSQIAVPEPATLAFFGIGMTGIIVFRHRFRKASVA